VAAEVDRLVAVGAEPADLGVPARYEQVVDDDVALAIAADPEHVCDEREAGRRRGGSPSGAARPPRAA